MHYMRHRFITIIALLVFALLIQNTCPYGMAGKSTVAASCSHCPQKQILKAPSSIGQLSILSGHSSPFPLFVLAMPHVHPSFRLTLISTPQLFIPNTYKNALPDGLLRPPSA
jgi:hypothetical protein